MQWDLRESVCPEPLIQSKLWLKQARHGDSLMLTLSDSGSCRDISRFFTSLGHQVHTQSTAFGCVVTIVLA